MTHIASTDTTGIDRTEPVSIELVVGPRFRPLGGLQVNRVWPTARRRLIGPFIFFDHMQRAELPPGQGIDVPPHPHIGLATVTYLFEGEMVHRDSLGYEQTIAPRELNWMNAGSGIVHSERSGEAERARRSSVHGIQAWVALPREHEDMAPTFVHHSADQLPLIEREGVSLRLIAGQAFGAKSCIDTLSELFYVEADLIGGAELALSVQLGERAAYVVSGAVQVDAAHYQAGKLLVFHAGKEVVINSLGASKLMLFGGKKFKHDRFVWWNFVSSSSERIERAKRCWKAGDFDKVPGDDGFMPLPE